MTNKGMWTKTAGLLAMVACVAALSANPAWAQGKPAGQTLVNADLPRFLESAGYEPEANPNFQVIRFSREGYDFVVRTLVDEAAGCVWIITKTTVEVADINQVPGTTLQKLLQANRQVGPSFFLMNDDGVLFMARALDNRNVSTAKFRKELDQFCADYKKYADLLNPQLWGKAAVSLSEPAVRYPG